MNHSFDPAYLFLAANLVLGVGSVVSMWRTTASSRVWRVVAISFVPLMMLALVLANESIKREVSAIARYRPAFDVHWAREMTAVVAVVTDFLLFLTAMAKRRLGRVFTIAAITAVAIFFFWVIDFMRGAVLPGPGG
jgi:hypothetical protein